MVWWVWWGSWGWWGLITCFVRLPSAERPSFGSPQKKAKALHSTRGDGSIEVKMSADLFALTTNGGGEAPLQCLPISVGINPTSEIGVFVILLAYRKPTKWHICCRAVPTRGGLTLLALVSANLNWVWPLSFMAVKRNNTREHKRKDSTLSERW